MFFVGYKEESQFLDRANRLVAMWYWNIEAIVVDAQKRVGIEAEAFWKKELFKNKFEIPGCGDWSRIAVIVGDDQVQRDLMRRPFNLDKDIMKAVWKASGVSEFEQCGYWSMLEKNWEEYAGAGREKYESAWDDYCRGGTDPLRGEIGGFGARVKQGSAFFSFGGMPGFVRTQDAVDNKEQAGVAGVLAAGPSVKVGDVAGGTLGGRPLSGSSSVLSLYGYSGRER